MCSSQPELAATLQRIAASGAREFYEGETAHRLVSEMAAHGGLLTLADLQSYQAVERTPLTGAYRGLTILTAPLPSSGGIGILQMLGMLEDSGYGKAGPGAASTIHYTAEVMRRFFADRSQYLGDSDFVKVPLNGLLDPAVYSRAAKLRSTRIALLPAINSTLASLRAGKARRPRTTRSSTPPATQSLSRILSTTASAAALPFPVWASCSTTKWMTSPPNRIARICSDWCRAKLTRSSPASGRFRR